MLGVDGFGAGGRAGCWSGGWTDGGTLIYQMYTLDTVLCVEQADNLISSRVFEGGLSFGVRGCHDHSPLANFKL